MSPTSGPHGRAASRLGYALSHFIYENRLGECFIADAGFILATQPDTVRAPDFSYVSNARLRRGVVVEGRFVTGAPDLAVEVLSPSQTLLELQGKVKEYFSAGAEAVWIVDPAEYEIRTYTTPDESQVLTMNDELTGGAVLPGFRCAVADVFKTALDP